MTSEAMCFMSPSNEPSQKAVARKLICSMLTLVEGTEVSTENLYTQAIPHVCLGPQFTLHVWPESNNSNNKPQAETLVEAKWF